MHELVGEWALLGLAFEETLAVGSALIFWSSWLVLLSFPFALDKSQQGCRKDLPKWYHAPWPEIPVFLVKGVPQYRNAFKHLKALLSLRPPL